ncbi:MAG TPA: sugar ABC transporter ATP-binding protein [Aggregatilineales bacterium]|nr:sugar ABC transporter ATP-binding protein [Aggregatilineales bacterium]
MPSSDTFLPLIEALNISKYFGGITALEKASLICQPGSIHALVGENGAGKSTLIKIFCGVIAPDSGEIKLESKPSTVRSPADAARQGIVPVFQELSLMPHLTVAENVFVFDPPRTFAGLINFRRLYQQTEQLLTDLGFEHLDPTALVRELPLASRQLVEIAKALSRNPKLLILDEGTSALSSQDVDRVFKVMRRLRDEGRSVIFISHRMSEVEEIADRLTIFRDGQDVGSFPMGMVSHDEMVQLMIGRKLEQVFPPKAEIPPESAPVLEVRGLSWADILHDISFRLRKGEIVGLGGLDGQGQGELLFSIFGILRGTHGQILVNGERKRIMSPADASRAGINLALIPEDRKTEGLILAMSVASNIMMAVVDQLASFGRVDPQKEKSAVQRIIEQMQIRLASDRSPVRSLSGGNQQKVVIGKWLLTEADVFLLHDPTRGIDVGTKQEIYQLMRSLADRGAGILFFSTELSELVGMCNRVLVLYEGSISSELSGDEITEENIVSAALGLSQNTVLAGEPAI